jgi:thiamine pyrophosphokinase
MDADQAPQPMVLVVIGGDPGRPCRVPETLHPSSVVVAVDSGLDRALAAHLPVHHVIGDLDSADPSALASAAAAGARLHRYEADKDATDLELALGLVATLVAAGGPERVLVVGSGGGRLDLLLGDVLALAGRPGSGLRVEARFGEADVHVVRPGAPAAFAGEPGAQVSLLPVHGPARGVTTTGLRWPLTDAALGPGTTRAVSNEVVGATATVSVSEGVLVVVVPGSRAPAVAPRTTAYDPTPTIEGDPR